MKRFGAVVVLSLASVLLAACPGGFGFVYDQPLIGPYRLVAVDDREDMVLCRGLKGGNCAGDGFPGPTVFAAGGDDRFLVMARHPTKFAEPMNRSVAEYYYAERSANESEPGARPTMHGPFDEAGFDEQTRRLDLPGFSVVFEDLK